MELINILIFITNSVYVISQHFAGYELEKLLAPLTMNSVLNEGSKILEEIQFEDVIEDKTSSLERDLIAILGHAIVTVNADGQLTGYAGKISSYGYKNGALKEALFHTPVGLVQLNRSSILVCDKMNYCIRHVDREREKVSDYAGRCQTKSTDTSTEAETLISLEAVFYEPGHMALYDNMVYIPDMIAIHQLNTYSNTIIVNFILYSYQIYNLLIWNEEFLLATIYHGIVEIGNYTLSQDLREVEPAFKVGSLKEGNSAGNFTIAKLNSPAEMAVFSKRMVVLADLKNNRIMFIDLDYKTTKPFCQSEIGFKDGAAADCQMIHPKSILVVNSTIYIGERCTYGGGLRKISIITTATESEGRSKGLIVLIIIGALAVFGGAFLITARCCLRRLERQQNRQDLKDVDDIQVGPNMLMFDKYDTDSEDSESYDAKREEDEQPPSLKVPAPGSIPLHPTGSIPLHPTGSIPLHPTGSIPLHPTGSIPLHPTGSTSYQIEPTTPISQGWVSPSPSGPAPPGTPVTETSATEISVTPTPDQQLTSPSRQHLPHAKKKRRKRDKS